MESKVRAAICKNAFDFISESVERLEGNPSERDMKYATIHLATGLELLMKAKLHDEHWSLVYKNPAKASRADFNVGNFESASGDECLDRLVKVCGVSMKESHREAIKHLKHLRNRLVHFAVIESADSTKSIVADVLEFLLEFVAEQLGENTFDDSELEKLDRIRGKLTFFQSFVSKRWSEVERLLVAITDPVLACPSCRKVAWIIKKEYFECLFCRRIDRDLYGGIEAYCASIVLPRHPEYDDRLQIGSCQTCGEFALAAGVILKGQQRAFCFNCHRDWDERELDFAFDPAINWRIQ